MQSRLLDMLTLRGEFDCRRRWRRFWTMETIFWLNKTCIRPKKDGIKCLVKGKNRLHRPKSSPGVLFLVVPSPAISAYRGTKRVCVSSLSTGPFNSHWKTCVMFYRIVSVQLSAGSFVMVTDFRFHSNYTDCRNTALSIDYWRSLCFIPIR